MSSARSCTGSGSARSTPGSREAQAHAARLAEAADAVQRAGAGYAEIDDNARRRHLEVQ